MKKSLFFKHLVLVILLSFSLLFVQSDERQKIIDAEWFVRPLAEGVVVRSYQFDDLFGGPQHIYVAEVDMSVAGISLEMPYRQNQPRAIVPAFAGEITGAAVAINGNYFDSSGSVQYLKVDGTLVMETLPEVADETGIGINADGDVNIFVRPSAGWASLTDQVSLMASNTNVLYNGEEWPHWHHHYNFYYVDRHPRTMLGKTEDNRLLLVVVDGRSSRAIGMTYHQLAEMMIALGAENCAGLDGGGSSTFWGRGEPGSGVMNVPSDGSPRSVANALVIVAPELTDKPALDARFLGAEYQGVMLRGEEQSVTFTFQNYGTQTWNSSLQLVTTEETGRASAFYDEVSWVSSSVVTGLNEATVEPMGTGTFTFTLKTPHVESMTDFVESFGLADNGSQYFGPQQNRLYVTVVPPHSGAFIIESRLGGQNFSWYEDEGFADSGLDCQAFGLTPGIGMRYASTYRSIVGNKVARFRPYITDPGIYRVSVSWGAAGLRRDSIAYTVEHGEGSDQFILDQTVNANIWNELGDFYFSFGNSGYVQVDNSAIDVSGSFYTAGCMFEPLDEPSSVLPWTIF